MHTHIDAHGQRRGVLAEAECVCPLQGRRKERGQKSWNKRMLASISRAVERDGGVRKRIHSLCTPPTPPHPIHPFPSLQPSHPIISILERRRMKGTTPQWQHFSLQTFADAFWRLLNCTWYRQGPFSFKSKTDCFSLGRGLLDKRDDKAGTVKLSGGRWMEGGKLEENVCVCVCMYTFLYVFSFVHACATRRLCLCPCVANVHTCGWQPRTCARDQASDRDKITGSFPTTSNSYFPLLFVTCSHLPFSYLGLLFFIPPPLPPLCCLSWPSFLFLPLKSMLHLCAVTFEQKQLRTSQRAWTSSFSHPGFIHQSAVLASNSKSNSFSDCIHSPVQIYKYLDWDQSWLLPDLFLPKHIYSYFFSNWSSGRSWRDTGDECQSQTHSCQCWAGCDVCMPWPFTAQMRGWTNTWGCYCELPNTPKIELWCVCLCSSRCAWHFYPWIYVLLTSQGLHACVFWDSIAMFD